MRVYVGGTFDLFHPGHVELLRRARKFGPVVVALNSDRYAEELKGKTPVMDYRERAEMLLVCEYVDDVVCNDGHERKLLDWINPKTIVYANDGTWTRGKYLALFGLTEADLDKRGTDLVFLDYTEGVSTTDIVERIRERIWEEANQKLDGLDFGRHRADGGEAREYVPADAPSAGRRDAEA